MTELQEVEEFISRRFPTDCKWTDGNCYYFAAILCSRFPHMRIYYDQIEGHFIACSPTTGKCYDFHGSYEPSKPSAVKSWDEMRYFDAALYMRIVKDCVI